MTLPLMVAIAVWVQPTGALDLAPAEIYPFIPLETLTSDSTLALEQLKKAPAEDDDVSGWHFGLARHYHRRGQLIDAARHARRAAEIQGAEPSHHLFLASIYCRMQRYELARTVLARVLSGQELASEGRILLAYILLKTDEMEALHGLLQEVLKSDPHNPYALYLAGVAYSRRNRPEDALQNFRAAAVAGLDLAELHFHMGRIYARDAATFEQAIQAFQLADRSDRESLELKKELGLVYYRTGRYQEALEELKAAVHLQPEFPQAFHILARLYQ